MTITEVKERLEVSNNPVAKVLHQGVNFKVLIIGFKKGMTLKEHKTHNQAKLTVLEGLVRYKEGNRALALHQYDELEIPIDTMHSVEALFDSICILTQGK